MATPAEQLLAQHPGDRAFVVPKTKAALARELEAAGLVRLSVARTGAITLTLTEAGARRREELQLESIRRAAPTSDEPPSAPSPRPRGKKAAPPAPTKRTASLDELFGPGAFHPGPASSDPKAPATVADLQALEERLVERFRKIVAEALSTRR